MIAAGGRPPIGAPLEFSLTEAGDGWATFEDARGGSRSLSPALSPPSRPRHNRSAPET